MEIRGSKVLLFAADHRRGRCPVVLTAGVFLAACLLTPRNALAGHTLTVRQQAVLNAWLARHRSYRLATDADCDCEDDISEMKSGYGGDWPKAKDYHPYIAAGDFRGNGISDFAVAVLDRSAAKSGFTLLVFDGPFHSVDTPPVFVQGSLDLKYKGFSYGPPRPKPYRLVIGPFESDNTCILIPHGRTYRLDCN